MTHMRWRGRSTERWWVFALFVVALVIRVFVVVVQDKLGLFDISFEGGDGPLYVSLAHHVLDGSGFAGPEGAPTAFVTPGYPLFLAGLFIFSDSILFIGLAQSVLGGLTVVFLALTAQRISSRTTGILTGGIAAVYPHSLLWTTQVMTETLYVFSLALVLYLIARLINDEDPGGWLALLTGTVAGFTALVRPPFLGLAILAVLISLACGRRWRRRAVFGVLGLIAIFGPWVLRNAIDMDAIVITSTESGYVLWQGNSPHATGGTRGYVDLQDFEPLQFPEETDEVERDRIYMRRALEWMREHPTEVLALAPRKLANMWRPSWEGASTLNLIVTLLTYPVLIALSLIGLVLIRKQPFIWIIGVFLVYHLLLHALVTGMIRFRLPLEMVLMVPAGIAAARIGAGLRSSRRVVEGSSA